MTWRMAKSLEVLLAEVNAAAPNRSKVSDGGIGDPAHQAAGKGSDHNPWVIDAQGVGVVRARDFTEDPKNGCDAGFLAENIRLLGIRGTHPALVQGSYVIWDHRIASATDDGAKWDWEPYNGSDAHTDHVHLSVGLSGFDSDVLWGVTKPFKEKKRLLAIDLSVAKHQATARRKVSTASVRRIQRRLNRRYRAGLRLDGVFGAKTKIAYRRHQILSGTPKACCFGVPTLADLRKLARPVFRVIR